MLAITQREVVLSVRADEAGNKRRIRLAGEEFIRRFMLHVPKGIKRIRHYGLLASACKTKRLAQARQALGMPVAQLKAMEAAADSICVQMGHDMCHNLPNQAGEQNKLPIARTVQTV